MNRSDLLPPLPEAEWSQELKADLTGDILNIHRIVAHNPALMMAYAPLRNYIVKESSLTERQRELLILRTGHNMQSEYEWAHHVVRGRAAGLTENEIERVRLGPSDPNWNDEEANLLRAVDQIQGRQDLTVELTVALQQQIGSAALLDLIYTVGVYLTLGTILKTFAVPIDETIRALT